MKKIKIQLLKILEYLFPYQCKKYYFSNNIEREVLILDKFISSGDVVIDIGANIGQYTYYFEARKCNVISFEPNNFPRKRLNNLFGNNNKITILPFAAGPETTVGKIFIPSYSGNLVHTRGSVEETKTNNNSSISQIVAVVALDEILKLLQVNKVDFIKIDVEGAEMGVIKGAIKTIDNFKPTLLIEIEKNNRNLHLNVWDFLKKRGYNCFQVNFNNELQLVNKKSFINSIETFSSISDHTSNFIFVYRN